MLDEAGVTTAKLDPRAGLPGAASLLAGAAVVGEIWIGEPDAEKALGALDAAGVHIPLPIVDRSDPRCPCCESALDPTGPPRCPDCATMFQWVEIDGAPIDLAAPSPPARRWLHSWRVRVLLGAFVAAPPAVGLGPLEPMAYIVFLIVGGAVVAVLSVAAKSRRGR